jgi:hypothetical protein
MSRPRIPVWRKGQKLRRLQYPDATALQAQVDAFNATHAVGSDVWYHPVIGEPQCAKWQTSTLATVLSGHTAVVWLDGFRGCVALDALTDESFPSKSTEAPKA